MKRFSILLLAFLLLVLLGACGGGGSSPDQSSTPGDAAQPEAQARTLLPPFQALDLEGNEVDNDLFRGYELTMVKIWGTYCRPCIREIPDLERLYQTWGPQQVQIIGIVSDDQPETAREIMDAQRATYLNLIPDHSLRDNLVSHYDYVPVTVFVDREGRLLDAVISGSRSYDFYNQAIQQLLAAEREDTPGEDEHE